MAVAEFDSVADDSLALVVDASVWVVEAAAELALDAEALAPLAGTTVK